MIAIEIPGPEDLRKAAARLRGSLRPSPLLPLDGYANVWLKLENLQPTGSFKVRGAGNAMQAAGGKLESGVVTASAGNMAQGVAWWARRLGVAATAVVPDRAPRAKTDAIERLGGRVRKVPFDDWWALLRGESGSEEPGYFLHPVADREVIAGNGTIGLELLEQLPEVQTVLVPFGGGGLSCGIAAAFRHQGHPARVVGCEVETATPLTTSLEADAPCEVSRIPSFVEGIGGKGILPVMWPLVRALLAGSRVSGLHAIAAAIRLLAERHRVVAEGAGAASVAAALQEPAGGPTVCVVSGGNIDAPILSRILLGETPR